MINTYLPVYKSLEHEFSKLMFDIHIDDNQLNVYSLKISELILRAAVEIESISKDLYLLYGGSNSSHIKYDEVAIKHLNKIWSLEKKVIIISSPNCFLTNREIYPFIKNEISTGRQKMTFGWNNAYQNIKHDRVNSVAFGSIKYLFDIMAALFTLNIYYRDDIFDLGPNMNGSTFSADLGSDIFSVNLHRKGVYDSKMQYNKQDDLDKSIYVIVMTEKSQNEWDKSNAEMQRKRSELFAKHPKYIKYISENDVTKYTGTNLMRDVLGEEDFKKLFMQAAHSFDGIVNKTFYEAILNKNIIFPINKNRP